MLLLFWFSALLLLYIYLGYPLLIWMWAKVRPRPFRRGEVRGTASVILAVYNEAPRLAAKIASLRAADPGGRILEILVGSDGSTDDTKAVLERLNDPLVRLVAFRERRGKPAVLNDLAREARGDFLVFTDARQDLAAGAVESLLAGFVDPDVGVISGELVFREASTSTGAGQGMGAYWEYEKFIRRNESLAASVPGATGALYAIRRAAFRPISADTLLDDVAIPMQVIEQGARCVFEPSAMIFDDASATPALESVRKRRTLAGCFQLMRLYPKWLAPGGHPIWALYISHKVLRLASPVLLLLVLVSSILLAGHPFFRAMLVFQGAAYACALFGLLLLRLTGRAGWLSLPLMFVSMNLDTIRAAFGRPARALQRDLGFFLATPRSGAGLMSDEAQDLPLVSAILATYNGAHTVRETIESVLAQTYPNMEFIVVDDASTDNTVRILEEYADRIRLVRRGTNSGICAVPQREAVKLARGAYFAFIDQDDLWDPQKIERQVAFMGRHTDLPLCHTYMRVIDGGGKTLEVRHNGKIPPTGPCALALIDHCFLTWSSVMARPEALFEVERTFPCPEQSNMDIETYLCILRRYPAGFGFIPEVLGAYRRWPKSMSRQHWRWGPEDVNALDRIYRGGGWKGLVPRRLLRRQIAVAYGKNAEHHRHAGYPGRALYFGMRGLRYRPASLALFAAVLKAMAAGLYGSVRKRLPAFGARRERGA